MSKSTVLTPARACFRTAYGLLRACGSFESALRNLERNGKTADFCFLYAAHQAMNARGLA